MYAEERQRTIVALARRHDRVAVAALAEQFDVTAETIRRDLELLDQRGILRRVHGGAVPVESVRLIETTVTDRAVAHSDEKASIAKAALAHLPSVAGASVLLDAGTTTARLAELIPDAMNLALITNAIPIASQLTQNRHSNVHLLGGRVRGMTQSTVGGATVEALRQLRVDVAFLGTNGITIKHGLSTPDSDEAAVKRAMVDCARTVVALVDSSKVGVESLLSFARLDQVDVVISDDKLPDVFRTQLTNQGIEVVVA